MGRPGQYLYRRGATWWLRIQGSPEFRKSLGTTNRAEAEIAAIPYILEHKRRLQATRGGFEALPHHAFNVAPVIRKDMLLADADAPVGVAVPAKARADDDAKLLETWIVHRNIKPREIKQARGTFDDFKRIVGKRFANSDRDDGRQLAAHYLEQGLKSATIERRIGYLRGVVNLAIKDRKLEFNPFSDVVPKLDDSEERPPLNETEMALMRAHLPKLSKADQLLWKVVATTGMRLSEAFQIKGEADVGGIRTIRFGTKSVASKRTIPVPDAIPPIRGPMFPGDTPAAASKRLNRAIRNAGIVGKVVHGLRHRAIDRLREAECPEPIAERLVGHGPSTVHRKYGLGYPMRTLKSWIEGIGF